MVVLYCGLHYEPWGKRCQESWPGFLYNWKLALDYCSSSQKKKPERTDYFSLFDSWASGEGNGNPCQYSCLENPMDRQGWLGYSAQGRKELDTTERPLTHSLTMTKIVHQDRLCSECYRILQYIMECWCLHWRRKWQPTPLFLPGIFPWTEEHCRLQSVCGVTKREVKPISTEKFNEQTSKTCHFKYILRYYKM